MDSLNTFAKKIEQQQVITILSVVILYLGGKYVIKDFEDQCDINLDSKLMKGLTVFSLVFVNIKDIRLAIFSVVIYQIIHYLLIERGWCRKQQE